MKTANLSQLEFGDDAHGVQPQLETKPMNGTPAALGAARAEGNSHTDRALQVSPTPNPGGARSRTVKRTVVGLEELLTFADAATVLGISLRQFRRLVDGGKVAFIKVSERTPRVRPSELQRFLNASGVKYSEVQS